MAHLIVMADCNRAASIVPVLFSVLIAIALALCFHAPLPIKPKSARKFPVMSCFPAIWFSLKPAAVKTDYTVVSTTPPISLSMHLPVRGLRVLRLITSTGAKYTGRHGASDRVYLLSYRI